MEVTFTLFSCPQLSDWSHSPSEENSASLKSQHSATSLAPKYQAWEIKECYLEAKRDFCKSWKKVHSRTAQSRVVLCRLTLWAHGEYPATPETTCQHKAPLGQVKHLFKVELKFWKQILARRYALQHSWIQGTCWDGETLQKQAVSMLL